MTAQPDLTTDDLQRLTDRVTELEHERRHLLAVIEILEEISSSLHFTDILQTIARKLGETFGLDRASIYLAERTGNTVRLVASYENPAIRNFIVDLARYPELQRAVRTGQTVFIADAASEPSLAHARDEFEHRRVKSITVVPITWRRAAIGAIFLRTFRDGPSFSEGDLKFVQVVASLTAKSLRNAHRYERLLARGGGATRPAADRERAALVAYLARLLAVFNATQAPRLEAALPRTNIAELDRLVGVAMRVIAEEASTP
jgi:GAF domain-containing protein